MPTKRRKVRPSIAWAGCKCKDECPYDAEKIYITNKKTGVRDNHGGWPCNALCVDPTEENVYEAIKTGPYGRCVYHCDNDVVDHEVVDMEFENGATAVFTMTAFTKNTRRTIRVMGTLGELEGDSVKGTIEVKPFNSDEVETHEFPNSWSVMSVTREEIPDWWTTSLTS